MFKYELFIEVFLLDNVSAVILAAGEGKRMKSKHPKVSHKLLGKSMLQHLADTLREAGIYDIVVVIGHQADEVKECVDGQVKFVLQQEQKGTAHAVMCAADLIKDNCGITLILNGDAPLILPETIKSLTSFHKDHGYQGTVITSDLKDPAGYGRIVKDFSGAIEKIVEEKDATEQEKKINEINSGMYCFDTQALVNALKYVNNNNAQHEYYLTDVIGIMKEHKLSVGAYKVQDNTEILGINSRVELAEAIKVMRDRIVKKHMLEGVTIIDPDSVYIDKAVSIGMDTVIYPGAIIEGSTVIGENCIIGPNTRLSDAVLCDEVEIESSVVLNSEIKSRAKIGPFAYIRPESVIGEGVKVGDFVEVKKSVIGKGTKASHLTYIGDAEVGENVNFGCGTITVNYDGSVKHKTVIGNNAFIGCNTNLVAPVKVNDGTYIAAGSTITDDVPEGALAIARARQVNKEGWVAKRNLYRKK